MYSFSRPPIDPPLILDADGQVIDYGNRWDGSPPEDTYSVDTHPERFASLHAIANALIDFLADAYDVEVTDGLETASDLVHPHPAVVRAVRVRPVDEACAALTFAFTDYPGLIVHAGALHDFPYPNCGCDACDSTWDAEASELERQVAAVVAGGYREAINAGLRPWAEVAFTYPDGFSSGRSPAPDLPRDRLRAARAALRKRSKGWAPWPER